MKDKTFRLLDRLFGVEGLTNNETCFFRGGSLTEMFGANVNYILPEGKYLAVYDYKDGRMNQDFYKGFVPSVRAGIKDSDETLLIFDLEN